VRQPNWYLDPLVAAQKRAVHLEWIIRNVRDRRVPVLLKTDLFEEAHGGDELLFSLPFRADRTIGIDIDSTTVLRAAVRANGNRTRLLAADVRHLPLPPGSVNVVLSNSTLDHFQTAGDLEVSLRELARVLKPGGLLLITLDNPQNPLYFVFRACARWIAPPLRLGRTASSRGLAELLRRAGFEVLSSDRLVHNPRFVSTLLFLALRRVLGARGDGAIAWLLRLFAAMGRFPTSRYTAVFIAACARKR
jgi:SAM-dependent methyltransferase